ncbi:hypothetical protein KQI52_01150 [bacterium]|nr:hypothetical protein [bacterium]
MTKRTSLFVKALMLLVLALLIATGCEDEKSAVSPEETYDGDGFPVAIITATPDGDDSSDIVAAFRAASETTGDDIPKELIPEVYDVLYTQNNPDAARSFLNSMRDEDNRPMVVVGPTTDEELVRCLDYCDDDPLLFLSPNGVSIDHELEDEYVLSFGVDLQHIVNAYISQTLVDRSILEYGCQIVLLVPEAYEEKDRLASIFSGYSNSLGSWYIENSTLFTYSPESIDIVLNQIRDQFPLDMMDPDYLYVYFTGTSDNAEELRKTLEWAANTSEKIRCMASPEFARNEALLSDAAFVRVAEARIFFCLQPSVNMYGGTGEYYNRLEARLHRSADFKAHISHDIHRLLADAVQSITPAESRAGTIERLRNRIIELGVNREGISGPLEFDVHGERYNFSFDVLRIHNGQWKTDGTMTGHNLRK